MADALNVDAPKTGQDVQAGTEEALVAESPTQEQVTTANTEAVEAARSVGPATEAFVSEVTNTATADNPLPIALQYLGVNESDPEGTELRAEIWDNVFGADSSESDKFTKENQAWCAGFVNHILKKAGADSLQTNDIYDQGRAKEYLGLGEKVSDLSDAKMGDLVVKMAMVNERDKNGKPTGKKKPQYHVGFFSGYDSETGQVLILGGNQDDQVNVTAYPESQVQGVRRIQVGDLTRQDKEKISQIEVRKSGRTR